jgi:hypothetical protein
MNSSPSTNSISLAGNTRIIKPNTGQLPRNLKNQATSVSSREVINPFKYEKKANTPKNITSNNASTPKVENDRIEELKVFHKTPITRSSSNNGIALRKIIRNHEGETNTKNSSEVSEYFDQLTKNNIKMNINSARENSVKCHTSQRSFTEIKNEDNICKTEGNLNSNYNPVIYDENHENVENTKEGENAQIDFINRCLSQGIIYNPRAKLARSLVNELVNADDSKMVNLENNEKEIDYEMNTLNTFNKKIDKKALIPSRNPLANTGNSLRSNPSIDLNKNSSNSGNNFNKSNVMVKQKSNLSQIPQFNRFLRQNSKSKFSASVDNLEKDNDSFNSSDKTTINSKMTNNKNKPANENGNSSESTSFNYYVNIEDLMMLEEKLVVIMAV